MSAPVRTSSHRCLTAALGLSAAVWIWAGWRLFWFTTDDAYIAFRYVRNLTDGYGPVWNRAPFLPVEGYTSPLWVALLALVWRVLGIAPPQAANVIGLWCGYASAIVLFRFARRVRLPASLARARGWLFAIPAAGVLCNRHFYTWLSSGLETALFNLCALGWVALGFVSDGERDDAWARRFALCCGAIALTRPDGLLFMAFGLAQLALYVRRAPFRTWVGWLGVGWPFAAVAAHLLFRRSYYGEWLPNTYYAKFVAPWPAAGLRYAGSFLIENGLWLWLLLLPLWAARELQQRRRARDLPEATRALTWGALLIHIAYYTLVIGGDHFEYRVYSPWLPLAFLSCVPLAARLSSRRSVVASVCALVVALSLPIPWKHWLDTRGRVDRSDTRNLWLPLAGDFQPPLRGLVEVWDEWQAWLIKRAICRRHQEHKVFAWYAHEYMPQPAARPVLRWSERPVTAEGSVGVVGYEFPQVAVIDLLGLNDYVIARTPPPPGRERHMAHERSAPPGYLACFKPNVELYAKQRIRFTARTLSDAEIRHCETSFRAMLPDRAPHASAQ